MLYVNSFLLASFRGFEVVRRLLRWIGRLLVRDLLTFFFLLTFVSERTIETETVDLHKGFVFGRIVGGEGWGLMHGYGMLNHSTYWDMVGYVQPPRLS